jgi:hypothetical protein
MGSARLFKPRYAVAREPGAPLGIGGELNLALLMKDGFSCLQAALQFLDWHVIDG